MSPRRIPKIPRTPRLSPEQESPNRTPDDIPNPSTQDQRVTPPPVSSVLLPLERSDPPKAGEAAAPLERSDPPKARRAAPLSEAPRPPLGPIQTLNPAGKPFAIDWAQINQYDRLIAAAAAEFRVPFARLKAPIPIESGGKPDALQRNPRNGDSLGILQVVAIGNGWRGWQDRIRELAPQRVRDAGVVNALLDPETNLRVAASILRDFYDQHGSWDAASSAFFTGAPDWNGRDSVNGATGASYKRSLDGLLAEIWAADAAANPDTDNSPPHDNSDNSNRWRPYPYPKMVDLLVAKPAEGAGFDRVPFRRPHIRGFATHITDGDASIEWYCAFFSTGGERAWDALVDLVIGQDGRIGLLNDWRDPSRGGARAGWANGGVNGLEGEGIPFYRTFPAINVALVSAEHVARAGQPWSDALIAASIEVRVAIAQELRCPWHAYPYHPDYGGVSIEQQHRNFATKSCPANPYISTYDSLIRREVKARLKAWQGGIEGDPVTPAPAWQGPLGLPLAYFQNEFGLLRRYDEAGQHLGDFPFDPKGTISLAWLKRGEEAGLWPEAQEWRIWDSTLAPGKEQWVSFANGWRLICPLDNQRAGWKWLDES